MASADDYLQQLMALAPQGAAWPREGETVLGALFAGLAEELARVDARAAQLVVETDPRVVEETLAEWEAAWGLPDGCVVASPTVPGRRLALHQRVASLGGQSGPYYVGMAAMLGYDAEVETFSPSRLRFPLPKRIMGRPWAFAWRVAVYGPNLDVDAPVYASADLECVINSTKPAHTVVSFDYAPEPPPTFYFNFLD